MNAQHDETKIQAQEPINRRNFTITDLLPEPLTLTWGIDGTIYRVRTPDMFGARDAKNLKSTELAIRQAQQAMARAHTEEQQLQAMARLEQQADEFIKMIVMKFPEENLQLINTNKKLEIITWWGQEIDAQRQANQGEAGAHQPNRATRRRNRRTRR